MTGSGVLALGAAALGGLAAVVASQNFDTDIVPFFVALTFVGGIQAWAARREPATRAMRVVVIGVAFAWLVAAVWIGALLVIYQLMCACSRPPQPPEVTYLGLSATTYHLVGLYGGLALVLAEAARTRRSPGSADRGEAGAGGPPATRR